MFTLLIVFTFQIFWYFVLYDWYLISWKTGNFNNVLENVFASKHLILEWFPEPWAEEVYKEMIHFCSILWINYRTKVIVIMLYSNSIVKMYIFSYSTHVATLNTKIYLKKEEVNFSLLVRCPDFIDPVWGIDYQVRKQFRIFCTSFEAWNLLH